MTAAFRASSALGVSSPGLATSQVLTIPAVVQAGDVVLVTVNVLTELSVQSVLELSAPGVTWEPVPSGGAQPDATQGGFTINAATWQAVANGATAGTVVTATTQDGTDQGFWAIGTVSYFGASPGTPVDVAPAAVAAAAVNSITGPAGTTVAAGDLAVSILAFTSEVGAPADPAGTTSRLAYMGGTNVGVYIADSNGPVGAGGTGIGGANWTLPGTGTWLAAFTIALKPAGAFEPFYVSTDGNGVQTWGVVTSGNQPYTYPTTGTANCTGLRILPPSAPAGGYQHGFVYDLPVNNGYDDQANGNGLDTIRGLGAQNTYNCTIIEPSFGISPWYANNPTDQTQQLESFMVALRQWAAASSFASGGEKHYLIGFSKSGLGGSGLLFKHPSLWYAGAFWDTPFMMTDYDGTDPTFGQQVGGSPSFNYGTSANFTGNYELSSGNITAWNTAAGGEFTSSRRLWIGGYFTFQADVTAYKPVLSGLGVQFDGSWLTLDSSHAWHPDWVAPALASIIHPAASGLLMAAGII
jgi:hypothetical protein